MQGSPGLALNQPPFGPYKCIEAFYHAIKKGYREPGSYIEAVNATQINWWTKKEVHYFYTPKGHSMKFKKDPDGRWRWKDVPQKCMYLSSNPLIFMGPGGPTHLKYLFPEMYKFPINPDGTPKVSHGDLWKMMSTEARKTAFDPAELRAIDAYRDTTKYYDRKYTLCRERYENLGRSVYDTFNNKPGILKDIKWSGVLKDHFAYFVTHLDGKTAALGAREFTYTD